MVMIRDVADCEYSLNPNKLEKKKRKEKKKKTGHEHGQIRRVDKSILLSKPSHEQLDGLLAIIHHIKQQRQSSLQSLFHQLQQSTYCYYYYYIDLFVV